MWNRALSQAEITALYQASFTPSSMSYSNLIQTDVRPAMYGVNSSVYTRYNFNVADPSQVDRLILRMKYDDGFVAFLNGQQVALQNAPDLPAWNSTATTNHADTLAASFEEFNLVDSIDFLTPGANVLAIQGLNWTATNMDALLQAELTFSTYGDYGLTPQYFLRPTPGEVNGLGATDLGPIIGQAGFTPGPQPLSNQTITVTARVAKSFLPVTNVVLNWRVMFGNTNQTPMVDDGLGVYGAAIPAGSAGNGQMVRWFITANDSAGRSSRWPLFEDPSASSEYLGTVIFDPNLTSKVPIFHLFVSNYTANAGVDSPTRGVGGRATFFYDGELYDNIYMRVRGNTTRNYTKKSHSFTFNRDHAFKHPGPGGRYRHVSFTADYPDPTFMRQGLSFWLAELMGAPGPFYYPIRFQMNGDFYQLANHNDLHGEDLLRRLGYDPNGALYNSAGTVVPGKFSTGGFSKKSRKWDITDADYLDLANKISESNPLGTRANNLFDLFDVPEVINYLVVARWGHENDDVWANMSLYHDNDGDDLWRIIPFDMNLSWGAIYYEGSTPSVIEGVQATNDIHKAHPLYGSSQALALNSANYNRIYDVFFLVPQTREMFLRRLRTLMGYLYSAPGHADQCQPGRTENPGLARLDCRGSDPGPRQMELAGQRRSVQFRSRH
jgi:hypothetical protein